MTEDCTQLLTNTYQTIYGESVTMVNLNELAETLSRIVDRERPWTGKFLHSLLKGYEGFSPTERLRQALLILQRRLAGEDEILSQATAATVLAVHPLPAQTVILGQSRVCAASGCHIQFVPTHPRQKYHSKRCARLNRRR